MSKRVWRFGLAAAAVAAVVVIGIVLLTGNDSGAQLTPSSSLTQQPQNTAPAQLYPGTLLITRISEPDHNYDVYLVRSDGTGLRRLTSGPGNEEHAYWSPDGTRIVYSVNTGIWVMKADGSGKVHLGEGGSPCWSPDGKQILYEDAGGLSLMNVDGSDAQSLDVPLSPRYATWAPNGAIVFVSGYGGGDSGDPYAGGDLYAVHPDGTGLVRLTRHVGMILPSVSPDGSKIAAYVPKMDRIIAMPYRAYRPTSTLLARASRYFANGGMPIAHWTADGKKLVLGSSNYGEDGGAGLYVVNADGSRLTKIPHVTQAIGPDWRPVSASPRPAVSNSRANPPQTESASPRAAVSYSRANPPQTETAVNTTPRSTARVSEAGTIGWEFTPTADIEVTDLGCFDVFRDGLARAHRVGIFDAGSRRLLASVTVQPKSTLDGFFRWESLRTPLVLKAEGLYVVGTEDRGTLETVYAPYAWPANESGREHWAEEMGPPAFPGLYVSRPSEAAFTAPTVRQDLLNNSTPWFSPNFKFRVVSPSPPQIAEFPPGASYFMRGRYVAASAGGRGPGQPSIEQILFAVPSPLDKVAGLRTEIPHGTEVLGLTVRDGIATIDLSGEFASGGDPRKERARLAQVVYTLMQFGTVDGVRLLIDGRPLRVRSAEGRVQRQPLTRRSFADVAPPIFVDVPAVGDQIYSPLVIRGTAKTSAGRLVARVLDDEGRPLGKRVVTVTSGSGRGTFKETVVFAPEANRVTLEVYDPSADRRPRHMVRIPVYTQSGEPPVIDEPGPLGLGSVYLMRGRHVAATKYRLGQPFIYGLLLARPSAAQRAAGLRTGIPRGTEVLSLTIRDGIATVDLSGAFAAGGDPRAVRGRLAQVVYTLMQFGTVDGVRLRIDGRPLRVRDANGAVQRRPLTRGSFADAAPPIFVNAPAVGDHVRSPLVIRGTATTKTGRLYARILDEDGRTLGWQIVTTSASGTRERFKETVVFAPEASHVTLEVYEPSADGRGRIHVVKIPLFVDATP